VCGNNNNIIIIIIIVIKCDHDGNNKSENNVCGMEKQW